MNIENPENDDNIGYFDDAKYNQDLGNRISHLSLQINAVTYCFLSLIAEFDNREGWADFGMKSCADWLNWQCDICGGTARDKVRVAHRLEELPLISDAFAQGKLSYSKVRAITKVATKDTEAYYLNLAEQFTASEVELQVRKYPRVGEQAPKDLYQTRELTYFRDDDGMWVIRGRLPQIEGGLVVKALEEIMRKKDSQLKKDLEAVEPEIVSAETSEPEPGPITELAETCTIPQKCADAVCVMAENFIKTGHEGELQSLAG